MREHRRWGHRPGPGFRPPWWPENEPFPPSRGPGWAGKRRSFRRRFGFAVATFFLLLFTTSALAVTLVSGALGVGNRRALVVPAAILGLLLLGALFAVAVWAVRRVAGPVGDVMDAADRVAGGDHEARVEERGPRETRMLARAFNEMTERLRTAEGQRRNLLADLAHELRTPLSVIRGNVEGILDGVYGADRAHLEPVLEESRVMSRLLDDLETLSTAEAGALRLYREPVDPGDLVDEAVAAFGPSAADAGITLEPRIAEGLPDIQVDRIRIGQVLANLLSNSVRHTPPGGSVVVAAVGIEDRVAFSVTDSGPGIPADDLPHIFDRFVKTADSGGAGLGLAIARSLVEAHSGEITASSEPGKGTTIRFILPGGAG